MDAEMLGQLFEWSFVRFVEFEEIFGRIEKNLKIRSPTFEMHDASPKRSNLNANVLQAFRPNHKPNAFKMERINLAKLFSLLNSFLST